MPLPVGRDDQSAMLWIDDDGHRQDRLQRIALLPSVRGNVCLTVAGPDREIHCRLKRLFRQSRPIVADGDSAGIRRHVNDRRRVILFAGVERVVD